MRKALVTLLTAATLLAVASAMPVVAGTGATGTRLPQRARRWPSGVFQ